jgi:restriction endonuclease fold toxin 7 of polymorphic toxin system
VTVSGESSIPDVLTDEILVEIKGRAYVTMSKQLRIQSEWAREHGLEAIMVVRDGARVSKCVHKHFKVLTASDLGLHL